MYSEVSKLEEMPVMGSTSTNADSDIDFEMEELKQRRSSRIRLVVFIIVSVIVCAVIIALVASMVNSHTQGTQPTFFGEFDVEPIINDTKYFCAPIFGQVDEDTYVFKGIPYAAAPVGDLRWEAPQSISSQEDCWLDSAGLEAKFYGPKCYQYNNLTQQYEGKEDCLYLNVWSPQLGDDKQRCVMVYIHGGGLVTGSGHEPDTEMSSQVSRMTGCVIVSFNYRLNAFGYLALKIRDGHNIPGNFGFLDQIEALKWVQNNIAAFGGDPNKVTVFGDGSGATSIVVLVSTPLAQGLFQRAWLISAAPSVEGTLEQADHQNANFLSNIGCTRGTYHDIMKCLRRQSPEQVLKAAPYNKWLNSHLRSLPKKGEISTVLAVVDDRVVQGAPGNSPIESWADGPGNDVPLLIGSAAQEVDDYPGFPEMNATDWALYRDYIDENLGSIRLSSAKRAVSMYPVTKETPEYQLSSMISDMRAVCPTSEMARAAAEYFTSPVYRYVTTHKPQVPSPGFGKNYAFHKIDLYAFLGNLTLIGDTPLDAGSLDMQFSQFIQRLVGTFAEEGDIPYNWERFPNATAYLDSGLLTTNNETYKKDTCYYWQYNGFYPPYAWTN